MEWHEEEEEEEEEEGGERVLALGYQKWGMFFTALVLWLLFIFFYFIP